MRVIQLTKSQHTVVDDDVFEWASKFKWLAQKGGHTFYAAREIQLPSGKTARQLLHRVVLGALPAVEVDHIDGDGLNNLRENLRTCSRAENMRNRPKMSNNTSGYTGVTFHRGTGKWRAMIMVDCLLKSLGLFDTRIEAARARDAAAIKYHGKFARLNFP